MTTTNAPHDGAAVAPGPAAPGYGRARQLLAAEIDRVEASVRSRTSDLAGAQTKVDMISAGLRADHELLASLRATLDLLPFEDQAVQS